MISAFPIGLNRCLRLLMVTSGCAYTGKQRSDGIGDMQDNFLDGTSSTYLEELEERYLSDPSSVDKTWASFFHNLGAPRRSAVVGVTAVLNRSWRSSCACDDREYGSSGIPAMCCPSHRPGLNSQETDCSSGLAHRRASLRGS